MFYFKLDAFNMELGYAASMVFILLNSFESKEVLRELVIKFRFFII